MTTADFAEFYSAVHTPPNSKPRHPFPWQIELAERILTGRGWPEQIAVPTASGKTSVIDVAVFALAAQAEHDLTARTAPMRLFFVVDRRLVVDDVTRHAQKLGDRIEAADTPITKRVRDALCRYGGTVPLAVATLRGGMYRSDMWADGPNQPLVCASTVDQVGSRLLFRGYGISPSRRPVHAGLIGEDSLIVVDEAHLSQPFIETLRQISVYQNGGWAEQRQARPLQVVEMSATARNATDVLRLGERDYADETLKRRLDARKAATLREVFDVSEAAVEEAGRLANAGARVIGIVLNTVNAARAAFERLRAEPDDKILLTGRIRPWDRDRLLCDRNMDRMKAGRERDPERPFYVVATQTIEVGADLDFDALVTEAAPLDSLRQRFGRLDRLGRRGATEAVIVKPKRAEDSAFIYGPAVEKCWGWLNKHSQREATGPVIDFGVRNMTDLFESDRDNSVNSEAKSVPVLLPAYVEAWIQTNPEPAVEHDVAPFLHGPGEFPADVQVVWRADLPDNPANWVDTVSTAPPLATEALPLPIWTARKWLTQQLANATDVEGAGTRKDEDGAAGVRPFLIWRGPDRSEVGKGAEDVRPGDTIVVAAQEGGTDRYGWNPGSGPVRDIGDQCAEVRARSGIGKRRVRLHPAVRFPEDPERQEQLREALQAVAEGDGEEQLIPFFEGGENQTWSFEWYGDGWIVATARNVRKDSDVILRYPIEPEDDDADDTSSMTGWRTLQEHTAGVVRMADHFMAGCGVSGSARASIETAARLHDTGKNDIRFQLMLGNRDADEPLAKGVQGSPVEQRRRRVRSGWPKGARHEFGSVAIAQKAADIPKGCDRELVLHLIGTHHGYGRCLPPVWVDESNEVLRARVNGRVLEAERVHEIARLDSGWTDRFWSLNRKYGWWGLAYLEAILRRADCVRSREEVRDDRN